MVKGTSYNLATYKKMFIRTHSINRFCEKHACQKCKKYLFMRSAQPFFLGQAGDLQVSHLDSFFQGHSCSTAHLKSWPVELFRADE